MQDQNLVLQLQYKNEDEWTQCFDVTNVKLPSAVYLGFSAETGELHDNHDIISVESKNLYDAKARDARARNADRRAAQNRAKNASKASGGWIWFLLKIVLFFVVVAGGYVGFTIYRAQKRTSRF